MKLRMEVLFSNFSRV